MLANTQRFARHGFSAWLLENHLKIWAAQLHTFCCPSSLAFSTISESANASEDASSTEVAATRSQSSASGHACSSGGQADLSCKGGAIFPMIARCAVGGPSTRCLSTEAGPPEPGQGDEGATDMPAPKQYRKRLKRKDIGSYNTKMYEDLDDEFVVSPNAPFEGPMYDVRSQIDQMLRDQGMSPPLPDIPALEEEAKALGLYVPVTPKEDEAKPEILRWEVRIVLSPGGDSWHPANRKVKLQVYVRDLELSEAATKRFIALVGPRYNKAKDELTLVSERYKHREENRKDVLRILNALTDEAQQADLYPEEEEERTKVASAG